METSYILENKKQLPNEIQEDQYEGIPEILIPIIDLRVSKKKYNIDFIYSMFRDSPDIKSKINKDEIIFKAGSIMHCYYKDYALDYDYQFHALDFRTNGVWKSINLREKANQNILKIFIMREEKEIFYEMLNVMIQRITLDGYISRFIRIEPLNDIFYYLSYIIT